MYNKLVALKNLLNLGFFPYNNFQITTNISPQKNKKPCVIKERHHVDDFLLICLLCWKVEYVCNPSFQKSIEDAWNLWEFNGGNSTGGFKFWCP